MIETMTKHTANRANILYNYWSKRKNHFYCPILPRNKQEVEPWDTRTHHKLRERENNNEQKCHGGGWAILLCLTCLSGNYFLKCLLKVAVVSFSFRFIAFCLLKRYHQLQGAKQDVHCLFVVPFFWDIFYLVVDRSIYTEWVSWN